MDAVADGLHSMIGEPRSLLFSLLVFATVFIVVAVVALRFFKPPKILDSKPPAKAAWGVSTSRTEDSLKKEAAPSERRSDPLTDFKRTLLTIHRILAFILVASLAALTVGSYFATNPNDGSRLLTIVLAAGTLMLAVHLHGIDRRHRPTPGDRALEASLTADVRSDLAQKIGAALLRGGRVEWQVASPEVYSIDRETLDRARAMAADGRPMDEICRSIAPDYDQWGAAHQQAYRSVVRAAIEHCD